MTNKLLPALSLLLIACCACALKAQELVHYGLDDGLSSTEITAICEDDNYIWIATEDGLNRFDGHHFKVYKPGKGGGNGLRHSHIETLFVDSGGLLWIGFKSGGVDVYNPHTGRFTPLDSLVAQPIPPTDFLHLRGFRPQHLAGRLGRKDMQADARRQGAQQLHRDLRAVGMHRLQLRREAQGADLDWHIHGARPVRLPEAGMEKHVGGRPGRHGLVRHGGAPHALLFVMGQRTAQTGLDRRPGAHTDHAAPRHRHPRLLPAGLRRAASCRHMGRRGEGVRQRRRAAAPSRERNTGGRHSSTTYSRTGPATSGSAPTGRACTNTPTATGEPSG